MIDYDDAVPLSNPCSKGTWASCLIGEGWVNIDMLEPSKIKSGVTLTRDEAVAFAAQLPEVRRLIAVAHDICETGLVDNSLAKALVPFEGEAHDPEQ